MAHPVMVKARYGNSVYGLKNSAGTPGGGARAGLEEEVE